MRDETTGPGDEETFDLEDRGCGDWQPADRRPGDRRITVAGARRMLGMIGRNYDDVEIEEILAILYGMAELAYEDYRDGQDGRDTKDGSGGPSEAR